MPGEPTGRILHVNLTTGSLDVETPPESFYRTYLGGSAMGLYYILQEMQPGTDGLDPGNVLTVMDSLLTGAPISGQSRVTVNARSPLTDGIGDSQAGGFFPAELRFAGFTGIVITRPGRGAGLPVDPRRRGRAAPGRPPVGEDDVRGRRPPQGRARRRQDRGCPGRPGRREAGPPRRDHEHGQPRQRPHRHGRRDGLQEPQGDRRPRHEQQARRWPTPRSRQARALGLHGDPQQRRRPRPADQRHRGRAGGQHAAGGLPTLQLQRRPVRRLRGDLRRDDDGTILKNGHLLRLRRALQAGGRDRVAGPAGRGRYGGPEYETVATFGLLLRIADLPRVALANQICNEHGMDTIGAGATIGWAMDCFANGRAHRGGDRRPGHPFGRRRRHDEADRDDRQPRGLRRRAGEGLAAGRRSSARATTS